MRTCHKIILGMVKLKSLSLKSLIFSASAKEHLADLIANVSLRQALVGIFGAR